MSWFKKILRIGGCGTLLLLPAACGFQPMYGVQHNTAAAAALDDIEISNIPDRDGQELRNDLVDRIYLNGTPQNPRYILQIKPLQKTVANMGIRRDATYTRAEMRIVADVSLVDRATRKVLLHRTLHVTGGYDLLDNQFATIVAARSQTDNLLTELSDNILTQIGLYMNRGGESHPETTMPETPAPQKDAAP